MTSELAPRRPRVRKGFLLWSVPLLAICTLVGLHAVWDLIEARRLQIQIDAIAAGGAPINASQVHENVKPADSPAAFYYLAAAALAGDPQAAPPQDHSRAPVEEEDSNVAWLDAPRTQLILRLLDQATAAEFRGFPPGNTYSYQFSYLKTLFNIGARRTKWLIRLERPGAAGSLVSELKIHGARNRPLEAFEGFVKAGWWTTLDNLQAWIDSHGLGAADLASLQTVSNLLRESDDDDAFGREFENQRAVTLRETNASLGGFDIHVRGKEFWFSSRPLAARRLRARLDFYAALIAAARQPWPARVDALDAERTDGALRVFKNTFAGPIVSMANVRAARAAVALVRYQRAHHAWPDRLAALVPAYLDAVPIDPYSGEPLKLARRGAALFVYSIGPDRHDDGGPDEKAPRPSLTMPEMSFKGDTGFRVSRAE